MVREPEFIPPAVKLSRSVMSSLGPLHQKTGRTLTPKVLRPPAQGWCEERTPTLGYVVQRPEPQSGSGRRVGAGHPQFHLTTRPTPELRWSS